MSKRILTKDQEEQKANLFTSAKYRYRKEPKILEDYNDPFYWRLAMIDEDILDETGKRTLHKKGEVVLARRAEGAGASMPKIVVFSQARFQQCVLEETAPIEFLED